MEILASIIAATFGGIMIALIVLRPLIQSLLRTRRENRLIGHELRLQLNQFEINDLHTCLESGLCLYPHSPLHRERSLAQHHQDRERLLQANETIERKILRATKASKTGLTLDQIIDRV